MSLSIWNIQDLNAIGEARVVNKKHCHNWIEKRCLTYLLVWDIQDIYSK